MKTAVMTRPSQGLPYPNAITRRQFWGKLLDHVLIAACGMGIAAILLFLLSVY